MRMRPKPGRFGPAVLAVVAIAIAALASADTLHLREGGGTEFTATMFDDTYVTEYRDRDTSYGTEDSIRMRPNHQYGLLAVKDLFSLLPKAKEGRTFQVNSATLHVYRTFGDASHNILVYRMLTDWLPNAAGASETNVTYNHRDVAASLTWAGGGSFGTADYTTENFASQPWGSSWNQKISVDVTALVRDMYAAGANHGFFTINSSGDAYMYFSSSEAALASRPSLEIHYEYVAEPGTMLLVH